MNKFYTGLVLLLALSVVGACAVNEPAMAWKLPGDRHKVSVTETSERLHLVLDRNDSGLSLTQKAAIKGFVHNWRNKGHGPIGLSIPDSSKNANIAVTAAAQTREILYAEGLAWQQIAGGNYRADGQNKPPVILSFRKYIATAKNCNASQQNLALNFSNKPSVNFGCAVTANMAAMIADPYDLVDPKAMGTTIAERRIVTYEKYILGETTGVERTSDEEASVSDAVD
ncbi:MAG: CpaD family pilus assembly protein [Robiginitomaculum sp.]|nr:CpaD family pilus assembly protein [Robiginitomaculum sp.]